MKKDINVWNLFKISWEDLKKNTLILIGIVVVMGIISFVIDFFGIRDNVASTREILVTIFGTLLSIYISGGFILEYLKAVDGKKPCLKNIFTWVRNFDDLLKYVLVILAITLLVAIPVILWLILFAYSAAINSTVILVVASIVAGILLIWLSIHVSFAVYYVLEGRHGVVDSIKKSWKTIGEGIQSYVKYMLYSILFVILGGVIFGIISVLLTMTDILDKVILENIMLIIGGILYMFFVSWITLAHLHLYRKLDSDVVEVE